MKLLLTPLYLLCNHCQCGVTTEIYSLSTCTLNLFPADSPLLAAQNTSCRKTRGVRPLCLFLLICQMCVGVLHCACCIDGQDLFSWPTAVFHHKLYSGLQANEHRPCCITLRSRICRVLFRDYQVTKSRLYTSVEVYMGI